MFRFLRRLFGRNRQDVPPPEDAHERGLGPPYDPELQQILDGIDRKWTNVLEQERAAEALLTPRERIKKRLNLPAEHPVFNPVDATMIVIAPVLRSDVPTITVVTKDGGRGLVIPRVLFEYLYCQLSPTADDQRVINYALQLWGLGPESL
jgi:hypothetical protein